MCTRLDRIILKQKVVKKNDKISDYLPEHSKESRKNLRYFPILINNLSWLKTRSQQITYRNPSFKERKCDFTI